MASNSTPNSPAPHPSPATSSDSSLEQILNAPTNSPCPDERPASTSDSTLDQAVHVPRNSPDTSFPSTTGSNMDETVPEYAMTLSSYIEATNEENSSLIRDDPSSSDSLPDTLILSPCSSSAEVHCSPEQHSQSNRSDPDLLSRDEVPESAASWPVECSESSRMKRKRDSNHPQKKNPKRLRNERDTESPPSQSSSTVDSTADGSSVTEDKEGNSSSMSSED